MSSLLTTRHTDPHRAHIRHTQVLEAAAICFARSGFHGASMAEICKQAGMSAGHVYHYFDSKDAIILAFIERETKHADSLLGALRAREDPLEAILDDIALHVEMLLAPQTWRGPLEIYAEASRTPAIAARLREHDVAVRTRLRTLVKNGRERRNLFVDDEMLDGRIDGMISLFQGLSIRGICRPTMNRDSLIKALHVAMRALLLT